MQTTLLSRWSSSSTFFFFLLQFSLFQYLLCDPMRLWNAQWAEQFGARSYDRPEPVRRHQSLTPEEEMKEKFDAINYSPQGLKDLGEMQDLVGSADPESVQLIRPYYSMVEMTANGNKQGFGSYIHVLPDEEMGDKPLYSVGGSLGGGIEPAGVKHGYMGRAFGRRRRRDLAHLLSQILIA